MLPSESSLKPGRLCADPAYKHSENGSKFLSLQLGMDGLAYSIMDMATNTVELIGEYIFDNAQSDVQVLDEAVRILEGSPEFSSPFGKVVLGVTGGKTVLIPEALYEEGKDRVYLEFSHEIGAEQHAYSNALINLRARCVFGLDGALTSYLRTRFPNALLVHSATPLIDVFALRHKRREDRSVILHVAYSHFEMLCFERSELRFYNTFQYTTAEDLLYYVLFVFEQLGLNQENETVTVHGELDQYGNVAELLGRYLAKVEFGSRTELIKYSPALDVIPRHYYTNLFHQFLCG